MKMRVTGNTEARRNRFLYPRRATLSGRIGPTRLEAGLNSSHWGLGLLSNDGNRQPIWAERSGDRQIRIKRVDPS